MKPHKNNESCTKIRVAQKPPILEIVYFLWHKTAVPIFIERFLLVILAAIFISVILLNPFGMDTIQKITLGGAVILIAAFFAQTLHKYNESKNKPELTISSNISETSETKPLPTPLNSALKQEVTQFINSLNHFNQKMAALKPSDHFVQKGEDMKNAKTEEQRNEIGRRYFERESQEMKAWDTQFRQEYDREFYTKAKNLRDEMLKRIPQDKLKGRLTLMYENLAGPSPIREITSDLENLSNLLPD